MAMFLAFLVLLFAFLSIQVLFYSLLTEWELMNKMPVQKMSSAGKEELGMSWAVIVACSSGYKDYRYQMLRKEGLKEENIIVFLYNDLVNQSLNIIIDHPNGQDIYVDLPHVDAPQDYTGNQVTIENLYAVLLGNKSAVRGGSGKFVDSKPNDQIFVYYSNYGEETRIQELQRNEGINWRKYCQRMDPSPPSKERSNIKPETIGKQYQMVKEKASNYNTLAIASENNLTQTTMMHDSIEQGDVEPLFLWRLYKSLDDSSKEKVKVLKEIKETMKHRLHLDSSVDFIGKFIFGYFEGPSILQSVRSSNQPFVDDWDCLKSMIHIFETHCGSLRYYGMKHSKAFANICNRGVSLETVETACIYACAGYYNENWSPLNDDGF